VEKLRYAEVLNGQEHAKPPRVIRRTEEVEQLLDDIVANPHGIAHNPPDLDGLRDKVLKSFTDQPFESTRTIPDLNATCIAATASIADATFTPEQIREMTAMLVME
jgi:hypothetical protein